MYNYIFDVFNKLRKFIFLVKSLGLFSKIKLINFDEFYNFL